MKIALIAVGTTTDAHFAAAIAGYAERVARYAPFSLEYVPEPRVTRGLSEDGWREREADLILKALRPGDVVILLDERGERLRSVEFARWMERRMSGAGKRLVFLVGGPYGFSPRVRTVAQGGLSLSPMTFSHELVRLVFVEQLYRAMTILRGEPYHHE